MFKKARIRLTTWYLAIIMVISLSFSVAIFMGINRELNNLDLMQRSRQARVDAISNFLIQQGLPIPPENEVPELVSIDQVRARIIGALALINLSILIISGLGGYFLAGQTLDPISEMVKEQKDFVSNASHELRTPLTSLKTEIEVALRDKKMDIRDAKKLLQSNLDDVNVMQKLSNYLLALHKYENSDGNLKVEKLNLGSVVDAVIKNKNSYANQNNIKVEKRINKVLIKGNEEAITVLTTVLIENAIKYSGKAKKIEVITKKNGVLTVRDFGVGISSADLPHVFDRFYRADSSRSKVGVEGYGLGLSIAKSIVDKLDAKIEVKSKLGQGSTFSVRFNR